MGALPRWAAAGLAARDGAPAKRSCRDGVSRAGALERGVGGVVVPGGSRVCCAAGAGPSR